jgi:CubicO group peptidase (beta-lactamase class C family)
MRQFLVFFILLHLSLSPAAQKRLSNIVREEQVTGMQLSVVKNGQEQGYAAGYSNADTKQKVNAGTVFQAASLSKVVLAYIALKLADRKQIFLDSPLHRYYNYHRIGDDSMAKTITARMVLNHTTGFPNWAGNPLSKEWQKTTLRTRFTPGTAWSYSGEGFMYLQYAIQAILNASLEDIAVKEVFRPLHMKNSSFVWQTRFDSTGAYGHNKDDGSIERPGFFLPAAAYSLLTTAHDYQLFLQALIKGKGLSAATHALFMQDAVPVKTTSGDSAARYITWGLGIGREQNARGTAFWHWGDNGNFKCFFLIFPSTGDSMVCLTNSENGLALMKPLFRYYFGPATWWAVAWLKTAF